MKFSIITICYNEEKRIQKTLESVFSQKSMDYEHIIEDGGSIDSTLKIVSQYASHYPENHLKVFSEKDCGLYDAMNRAVARAKGDYICFINSGDSLFDENTLSDIMDQMENVPGMDWYYGTCIVIFPNGDEYLQIPTSIEDVEGRGLSEVLKKESLRLNHQAIFAHRNCFTDCTFDTNYVLRAELKWYYECLLKNIKIKKMNFPVCKYAQGGISERAVNVAIHAREMKRIFSELCLLTAENEARIPNEDNYSECCKNIYNQWLALRQAGLCVSDYLKLKGVKRIAIYGYAEFGTHLVNELKGTDIQIMCLIDRQDRFPFSGIKVIKPEEFDGNVDLVIVTAVLHFEEIRNFLNQRIDSPIASLEDVLEDMWK